MIAIVQIHSIRIEMNKLKKNWVCENYKLFKITFKTFKTLVVISTGLTDMSGIYLFRLLLMSSSAILLKVDES